jgi:hypothetical protein
MAYHAFWFATSAFIALIYFGIGSYLSMRWFRHNGWTCHILTSFFWPVVPLLWMWATRWERRL